MSALTGLEPASVFHYFEEICGIPHTSHHEKALSDYCVQFAKAHGLACRQDEMGNLLIKAPATPGYEKEPGLILQGHLDMVGDKTADCPLDLEKDAIHPVVDGGYVCAEGTTLGGDDGIAVAYALAVLDAKDIPHPALEVVLTVCEEVGLLGASAMDFSDLEGRMLVNIDSEEEGVLTAGCAGGRRVECHLPIARVPVTGTAVKADVIGLVGGHSGTEIHKGRANAIALLGRWLTLLTENGVDYAALALSGGAKENVIPKESNITLVLPAGITEGVHTAAAQFAAQVQAEYGMADPAIRLQLTEQGCGAFSALDADSTQRLRKALLLMPWGVQAMSMDVPGLVETSLNLGVAEMDEQEAILRFSIRSSVPSAKELLSCKVQTLTELLGGSVRFHGDYPAWTYARESALRDRCVAVYEAQYGKKPQIAALHAGLECGILSGKIEGLDCISFGPNLLHVHTPNERADIASVARVWEYLKAILAYKE
jgi:dipeptidase D